MDSPQVVFLLPGGAEVPVGPGGLIGRIVTAAFTIDDPRISEAHAMVSLRGGDLQLIALRGALVVGRRKVVRVSLKVGVRIELVPGIEIEVADIVLPERILAVSIDDAPPEPLVAASYVFQGGPPPRLVAGYTDSTPLALWTSAGGWRYRAQPGTEAQKLSEGAVLDVEGHRLRVVGVAPELVGVANTVMRTRSQKLTLVLRYDTVHLHLEGAETLPIGGIPARILTELGRFGAPVPWTMVASSIWTAEKDRFVMRQNWDRHLKALRVRLREAGVRDDLVHADGLGNIELLLYPEDRLVDES